MVHIYNSLPRTSQPAPWQTCDLDSDNGAKPAPSKRKDSSSNIDLKALRQSTAAALAAATAAVKASKVCAKMEKMHGEMEVEVKPKSSGRQKRRAQPATAASQEATEPEMKARRGPAPEAAEEDEENPLAQHGNEDGEESGGEDEDMEDNGDGNDTDDADNAASDAAGAPVSTQLDAPSAPAQLGNVCAISDAAAGEDVADKITGKVTGREVPGPQVLCSQLQPQEEGLAKGKGRGKGGRGRGRSRGLPKASSKKKDKASPKKRSDLKTDGTVKAEPVEEGASASSSGKAEKQRAKRGSQGTFAGRRVPSDPVKLVVFNDMKKIYEEWKAEQKAEAVALKAAGKKPPKVFSDVQNEYWTFMSRKMSELAELGYEGGMRMKEAARQWAAHKMEKQAAVEREEEALLASESPQAAS